MMSDGAGRWRLRLLGAFQLEQDRRIVTKFSKRKQDLLLAVLAVRPGHEQARSDVAAQLWPSSDKRARQSRLTEVFFRLNRQIRESGVDIDVIESDHLTFQLSPQVRTDVQEFDDLLARAVGTTDPAARHALVEAALTTYGAGLLPMLSDPLFESERQRLQAARDYAAELLVATVADASSMPAEATGGHLGATSMAQYLVRGKQLGGPSGAGVGPVVAPVMPDHGVPTVPEWTPPAPSGAELAERSVQLAEDAEPHLNGPQKNLWLDRLDVHRDELYAALEWGIEHRATELTLRIAGALWRYWYLGKRLSEGRWYLERAMALVHRPDTPAYAKAAHGAGGLALADGDLDTAQQCFQEALVVWRRLEDGEAIGRILMNVGIVAYKRGDYAAARSAYTEGLAVLRMAGSDSMLAIGLKDAALLELADGQNDAAKQLLHERIEIGRRLGDKAVIASTLVNLAGVVVESEGHDEVAANVAEARRLYQQLGDMAGVASCLRLQGWLALEQQKLDSAAALYDASYAIYSTLHDVRNVGESLRGMADVSKALGDLDQAIAYYQQAVLLLEDVADHSRAQDARAALADLGVVEPKAPGQGAA